MSDTVIGVRAKLINATIRFLPSSSRGEDGVPHGDAARRRPGRRPQDCGATGDDAGGACADAALGPAAAADQPGGRAHPRAAAQRRRRAAAQERVRASAALRERENYGNEKKNHAPW